ncbi:unnamed protein product [Chironomus riparius]|uniref:Galectin n=1 Tax=Chironomus riparius TaxID=315576 RepID=A0A9N9WS05_9DIPT|nr:unnamed protein product [Chironomus riparius]
MLESKFYSKLFPVEVGQQITIVGKSSENPSRFDIELIPRDRISEFASVVHLQISVRFKDVEKEPIVVRTAKIGIGPVREERTENWFHGNVLNPVNPGGIFRFDIFVEQGCFFISIDGKPFCTYDHVMPIETIYAVNVSKDVSDIYKVLQRRVKEPMWPAINTNSFESISPAHYSRGNVVVITGLPQGNHNGDIFIKLFDGTDQFCAHFEIRLFLKNHIIALNSQSLDGAWHGGINCKHPFKFDEVFKLAIHMTNDEFQVAGNGHKIVSFPYPDHHDVLFKCLNKISITANNGLSFQVQGFDYVKSYIGELGFEELSELPKPPIEPVTEFSEIYEDKNE